jgi:hypothetical protein
MGMCMSDPNVIDTATGARAGDPPAKARDAAGDDPTAVARWNRLAAQHEVDMLIKLREAAIEQATAMAKWLLASLLAINAAGALAIINSIGRLADPAYPATAFTAGMILPLLSATIIQYQNYYNLQPVQELIGYYLTVVDDGERLDSMEKELIAKAHRFQIGRFAAPLCGWLSGVSFIAGAYLFALQLVSVR